MCNGILLFIKKIYDNINNVFLFFRSILIIMGLCFTFTINKKNDIIVPEVRKMYGQNMSGMEEFDIKNELAIRNLIDIISNPKVVALLPEDVYASALQSLATYAEITVQKFSNDMTNEKKALI